MATKTAVVIGASGLIGDLVTKKLLNDPDFLKVRILVRKPINLYHDKLETAVTDFNNLTDFSEKMGTGDCLFCCVGTTQKKVKGDKNAYRKVDYDIPVNGAKIGIALKFKQFLLVSAVGADADATNF